MYAKIYAYLSTRVAQADASSVVFIKSMYKNDPLSSKVSRNERVTKMGLSDIWSVSWYTRIRDTPRIAKRIAKRDKQAKIATEKYLRASPFLPVVLFMYDK